MADWWGTKSAVSPRFQQEMLALSKIWGDTFKLDGVALNNGNIVIVGKIYVNLEELPEDKRTFNIRIEPQYNHPSEAPNVYIADRSLNAKFKRIVPDELGIEGEIEVELRSPHTYGSNRLCLFNPSDGASYGWNPSRSTIATIAGWAVEWCWAHAHWLLTEKWVGEEHYVDKGVARRERLDADGE